MLNWPKRLEGPVEMSVGRLDLQESVDEDSVLL